MFSQTRTITLVLLLVFNASALCINLLIIATFPNDNSEVRDAQRLAGAIALFVGCFIVAVIISAVQLVAMDWVFRDAGETAEVPGEPNNLGPLLSALLTCVTFQLFFFAAGEICAAAEMAGLVSGSLAFIGAFLAAWPLSVLLVRLAFRILAGW